VLLEHVRSFQQLCKGLLVEAWFVFLVCHNLVATFVASQLCENGAAKTKLILVQFLRQRTSFVASRLDPLYARHRQPCTVGSGVFIANTPNSVGYRGLRGDSLLAIFGCSGGSNVTPVRGEVGPRKEKNPTGRD
jgi:hypothetical protein